jgi:formate hydrogenlyase subunit 3/multisubunit Na+/H+ antiporter MnhD subunit
VGFFKPSTGTTSNKAAARLHGLIWVLIYGGLLTLVLGLSVAPIDDETAWLLIVGGGVVAAAGVALIVVRSRMKVD